MQTQVPQPRIGMTTLYLSVNPGGQAVGLITVESKSSTLSISASAVTLIPVYRKTVQPNIPVGIRSYFTMQQLGFDETVLRQGDLVVFMMAYPFSAFDPEFDYAENVRPRLWVFGWTDLNNDGDVSTSELTWLNFGYQRGTATEVPVAKLSSKLAPSQRLVLRVDIVPVRPPYPSTVPVAIEVVAYKRTPAPDVQVTPTSYTLRPGQSRSFTVRVVAPANAAPTAYERMVLFNINGTTYVVPPELYSYYERTCQHGL